MISQKVQEKLSNMGIRAPCRVTVASNKGHVTLSGSIQYEHQRHIVVHAIQGGHRSAAGRGPNAGDPNRGPLEDQLQPMTRRRPMLTYRKARGIRTLDTSVH